MGIKKGKKLSQRPHSFTEDFKRKVCVEFIGGKSTKAELQRKYNLRGHSCISKWLGNFGLESRPPSYVEIVTMPKEQRIDELISTEKDHKELLKKISELEAKNEALELMVKLAEDRLNIRIRKK